MSDTHHHSYTEFTNWNICDVHTTLWGFVIHVSAAEIEPEAIHILYLSGNYLTALVQHHTVSSIKKTSYADLGEELFHKMSR